MGTFKMISAARFLGLATACAALLAAGSWVEPAGAQGDACKADAVTASGRGKFRPFTKTKELEGKGSAMADAVVNWEKEVGGKFGETWKRWDKAKDTSFECAPTKSGKIIGSSFIGCTIKGRPCSAPVSAGGGPVASKSGGDGARDKGRRAGERDARTEGDRAYQREMAYQDRLAAERDREAKREYEREMARQDALAAQRKRDEARAWEQEKIYQRERERRERW
jgi:hypothetical protein